MCLRERVDLRKSHVLSEFLYEPTYERYDPKAPKKGRMLELPSNADEKLSHLQKGYRERLLCGECEQHLNKICEHYAAGVLRRMDETEIKSGEGYVVIEDVDYKAFKLFLMAQLWRAGVARNSQWEAVKLGPHEDRLRRMLLGAEPGKPHEYACALTCIPSSVGPLSRAVVPPTAYKIQGHRWYDFTARGYSFTYVVSSHSKQSFEPWLRLSENGRLPVISDSTGSVELRGGKMIRHMQDQRTAREGDE